jgi:hypothetical protein
LAGFPDDQYPYYMVLSIQTTPEMLALNIHLK